jgi:hypothetical protein
MGDPLVTRWTELNPLLFTMVSRALGLEPSGTTIVSRKVTTTVSRNVTPAAYPARSRLSAASSN